jgi:hypothetical protein
MNLISMLAIPTTLFLPSRSIHISLAKLTILSMIVTAFFLFTAGYVFPGGGLYFILWADAIVHGTTLPPQTAWREVGFPLLYVLSGFPWAHSFIGITIILAARTRKIKPEVNPQHYGARLIGRQVAPSPTGSVQSQDSEHRANG